MVSVDLHPKACNLCGGEVVFISNAYIYGREYGSGKCYYCTQCGAYVGTHKPWPDRALGLLANEEMRSAKKTCHALFDSYWKDGKIKRKLAYSKLADALGIPVEQCHFGYFDMDMLNRAYAVVQSWEAEL